MQPLVPGFIITGELDSSPTGPNWAAVRCRDDQPFVLKVIQVADPGQARALVARQNEILTTIQSEHVVRSHAMIDLADGLLALVYDQVSGGSLAHLLGARGQLTPGEAVTTVAPLLRALADLHAHGVVHGELTPANVWFSPDGRPLISDLGVAVLLERPSVPFEGPWAGGFAAPELVGGSPVSPASDVYAMAAVGWFCLAGAPPAPAASRPSLATLRPDVPPRLVDVLTSCLGTDPAARPTADEAAIKVLEAAPAESVALACASDPAAEITRRIRSDARPALGSPLPATRASRRARKTGRAGGTGRVGGIGRAEKAGRPGRTRRAHTAKEQYRNPLVIGAVALVAVVIGVVATWFVRSPQPVVHALTTSETRSLPSTSLLTKTLPTKTLPTKTMPTTSVLTKAMPSSAVPPKAAPKQPLPTTTVHAPSPAAPALASIAIRDVLSAPDSPRLAPVGLLQALVDARALAYVARSPGLLDLVYAPGAAKAEGDRANIATAVKNGGTYLGLAFVIKDVAFLGGGSDTARIRATIVTREYETGQPDGRKISHPQDVMGSCVFSLSLTDHGWRILSLTALRLPG